MKKANQEEKKANQEEKKVDQEEEKADQEDPATGDGQAPSARSLLAGLVTNMLHSPISWASVYLADQAITIFFVIIDFVS